MSTDQKLPPEATLPKKRSRRLFWIALVVGVVIVISAVVLYGYDNFTAFQENVVVTYHNGTNAYTTTNSTIFPGEWDLLLGGRQFTWSESFYNPGSSTEVVNVTKVVSNTPGFTLIGTSPSLPVTVPHSQNIEENNVTVKLYFTSSTPYWGVFNYTVYFDDYQ